MTARYNYFFLPLCGASVAMSVHKTDTIFQLKEVIQSHDGLPVAHQRLLYNGRQLADDFTVERSGITKSSTIRVLARLRGGTRCRWCLSCGIDSVALPGSDLCVAHANTEHEGKVATPAAGFGSGGGDGVGRGVGGATRIDDGTESSSTRPPWELM